MMPTKFRESRQSDMEAIMLLYSDAFPTEDLRPLVQELLSGNFGVLSLVAVSEEEIVGHVAFTPCTMAGRTSEIALLGPLAVASKSQRRGIGSSLVHEGLRRLEQSGLRRVQVLGDPAYYGRFGFMADHAVATPYTLPKEWLDAWQFLPLAKPDKPISGKLAVTPPWQNEKLWSA